MKNYFNQLTSIIPWIVVSFRTLFPYERKVYLYPKLSEISLVGSASQ